MVTVVRARASAWKLKTLSLATLASVKLSTFNVKESKMLLYFMNDCKELRLSARDYFAMAYQNIFGKPHPNVGADYANYLLHSELPVYVQRYIKERENAANQVHPVQSWGVDGRGNRPLHFLGQGKGRA
jgi:hypothetical protein